MKYLFIAEKPSLMRDVQSCYNKHMTEIINKVGEIEFVALAGHICTNCEPNDYPEWSDLKWDEVDYPIIPKKWKVKLIKNKDKEKEKKNKETLKQIKHLITVSDGIIVGTDSDTEGYGIYYLLETYLGLEKIPTLRFIEHSLTDSEILTSLLSMTDFHKDKTHQRYVDSFKLRSRADWLYGMNATRYATCKTGVLMKIGRVKAPTIKLIYDNSISINKFKSEKYYQVVAEYGSFKSILISNNKEIKYKTKEECPRPALEGEVKSCKKERKKIIAPKLYDLAAIQTEAGQKFGYKPDRTLEIIQSLYEKHKIISYPRTQCRFVSEKKAEEFEDMLNKIKVFEDLSTFVDSITSEDIARVRKNKNIVNDDEVSKESHDALLPTDKTPNLEKLNQDEVNICKMIYTRLLAQFMPLLEEDRTELIIRHGNYNFKATGNMVINQGWRILYKKARENEIPLLEEGSKILAKKINPVEKTTKPPKRLTQATLVKAMQNIASKIKDPVLKKSLAESKGIGTSATRANIIKDIIDTGYAYDEKDGLHISKQGIDYIETLKDINIISPVFAAILDHEMKLIQRGEMDYKKGYNDVTVNLKELCNQIGNMESKRKNIDINCPRCNTNLKTGNYDYYCPECKFKIKKEICKRQITEDMAKEIICNGHTNDLYYFTSKKGNKFEARLVMSDEYKIEFDFAQK